jgi:ATP-binding cassette subfamily F protein 1
MNSATTPMTSHTTAGPAFVDKPKEYKVNFSFQNPEDDEPTIAVLGVGFGHPDSPALFDSLHFSVGTHSRLAVVGPNGSGKTTMLQLLTGKLTPTSGEVSLHRKLKVGRFDQHFEELLPVDKTPVAFLRADYNLTEHEARKALGQFGLDGPLHLIRIAELSGGQKARVVFASLALQRPQVLILDEPTNHLDMESVEALVEGVKAFEGGVVMVSHDARLIVDTDSEVWVCEGAENVRNGGTGLRVEERGFEKYRSDLLDEVEAAAAVEERRALVRAEHNRKQAEVRRKKLEKLRGGKK